MGHRPTDAEFTEFVQAHGAALLRTATLLTGDRGRDGTAPDGVPSYEHQGALCPTVAVPAVDPQAVLTRCDTGTGVDLRLTLPDARGKGTWVLDAQARTDAPHTATEALLALVQGVEQNYG